MPVTKLQPSLEMIDIVKCFGDSVVNDHVNLTIYPGEVHALLGENGAGKTTLMNILYGLYCCDEGTIKINGERVSITDPKLALQHGIGMIHQHFMLIECFSAIENIYLFTKQRALSKLNKSAMAKELSNLAKQYGIEVDIRTPINKLSVGMQQKVEILKLLYIGADILILDEPTAVLAPQECDELFSIIEKMVNNNKSVVFISHKLDEVMRICDRVTILRLGKVVAASKCESLNKQEIIELLIGDSYEGDSKCEVKGAIDPDALLQIRDLKAVDRRDICTLQGVSFDVYKGEILGIAGLEGNGQEELMDAITGLIAPSSGSIVMNNTDLTGKSVKEYVEHGIAYVPSDRNGVATVRDIPLYQNWEIRRIREGKDSWRFQKHQVMNEAIEAIDEYDIRVSNHREKTENLSGGNLQKFIFARELSKKPKVFVCSNPTRGIDVKASSFIRKRLVEESENGMAIIVSSGDFDELFYLCDRLLVVFRGKICAEVDPCNISTNELGSLMLGVSK